MFHALTRVPIESGRGQQGEQTLDSEIEAGIRERSCRSIVDCWSKDDSNAARVTLDHLSL